MSNEKKNMIVPKLRFPEFKDSGEWEEKILKDACQMQAGKFVSASEINEEQKNDLFPCYGGNGLRGYTASFTHEGKYPLIGRQGALCGNITFANEKFHATEHAVVVTPKEKVDTDWLYYLLVLLNLNQYSTGQAQPGLSVENLEKVSIKISNSETEQQKIASCLSSLDDLIAAHTQKLDSLKAHKKGLMQQLFPAKGEKVPKLRFEEFKDSGDWEEKSIENIKSILTDYVANGSFQSLRENLNVVDFEDYAFYVRLTDLRAGLGHPNQKYVDESTYNFLNKSALSGGELLMANIGANVGEVWQMPYTNKASTLAPNMIMIKFKNDIESGFIYQYLTSNVGIANISSVISGSGHPKISKTDLRQVKVSLPPLFKEQKKITSCLSSLDELITAKTEKIKQLKLHKKGLMQGLFPSITDSN